MAYAVSTRELRLPAVSPALLQLARYTLVGALGTAVNAVVYLALRSWWDAVPANLVALVLSTVIGTEVNRHFTFGAARATHRWRAHVQTVGTIVFYALYSSAVLLLVAALVDDPSPLLETSAVTVASVGGGLLRFAVLRYWVFGREAGPSRVVDGTRGREAGVTTARPRVEQEARTTTARPRVERVPAAA